jgi:hypothetical protein
MRSWQFCNDLNLHGIPQIRLHVQAGSIAAAGQNSIAVAWQKLFRLKPATSVKARSRR